MFLRAKTRKKDGKEHRYWGVVENRRVAGGRVVQRHVLYLGEINSSQELAWRKSIDVLEDGQPAPRTYALFLDLDVFWAERLPPSRRARAGIWCSSCSAPID